MAEGLLRRKLEREGRTGEFRAASAGVWTADGQPATNEAIRVMAGRGIDIGGHRSRVTTPEIIEGAALILTMTRNHAEALRAEFPAHASRIRLLTETVGRSYDVQDPVGGTLSDYERTAQQLEDLIEQGYPQMVKLIGEQ